MGPPKNVLRYFNAQPERKIRKKRAYASRAQAFAKTPGAPEQAAPRQQRGQHQVRAKVQQLVNVGNMGHTGQARWRP